MLYIKLVLMKMGMNLKMVHFILSHMTSAIFVVLINGSPLGFLNTSRSIRKGCPLSHFLFLLVAKGLSRLVNEAKREDSIKVIKVTGYVFITHFLFIDEILIFGHGSLREIKQYKGILDMYCGAYGMEIKLNKYCMFLSVLENDLERWISQILNLNSTPLEQGVKYIGFYIKPSDYKVQN
jgi:hypothetical protein